MKIPVTLNFEYNPNNKFLCFNFICALPPIEEFPDGTPYKITILQRHLCYAQVIQSKIMYLDELLSSGYNYLDAGLEPSKYIEYLANQYNTKKWWRKKETLTSTRIQLVWFKKVAQLDLFNNNEFFTS